MLSFEEKLKKDIEEMEAVSGNQLEDSTTTEEEVQEKEVKQPTDSHSDEVNEEVIVDETTKDFELDNSEAIHEEDAKEEVDQSKPRANWKKRYTTYKSKTDTTIYKLRQDNARLNEYNISLNSKVDALDKKLESLSKSSSDALSNLSEEERDLLGDDTVISLQKLVDAQIAPLKAQLEEARKQNLESRKAKAEENQAMANNSFIERLSDLVPDYDQIDTDPKFLEWMEGTEVESGLTRKYIFKQAQSIGDVNRVASYFNTFKGAKKVNPLEKHISPTKTSTNTQQQKPKLPDTVSFRDYEKFTNDCIRGKYRGKEKIKQELELKFDTAFAEGRVV